MADTKQIQIPDGKGGVQKVTATKFSDGAKLNEDKAKKAFEDARIRNDRFLLIAESAKKLNKMHTDYADENGLDAEDLVAALTLEMCNCREFFPDDLGGHDGYDSISNHVYEWFTKQLQS